MRNAYQILANSITSIKRCGNPARHNSRKLKKLNSLIRRFGQVVPIIVDEDGYVIVGHAAWQVMRDLGYNEIRVVVADRDPAEIKTLRLVLKCIAREAVRDKENLRALQQLIDLTLAGCFETVSSDTMLSIDTASDEMRS
jgi:ParB-like chromosome segregation protein Spo0J